MQFSLTDEEMVQIKRLSRHLGASRSETVRYAVTEILKREGIE